MNPTAVSEPTKWRREIQHVNMLGVQDALQGTPGSFWKKQRRERQFSRKSEYCFVISFQRLYPLLELLCIT